MANKLKTAEDDIAVRKHKDNLVIARMREELDFASNCKREDRLLIIGLASSEQRPAQAELKKWLVKLVGDTLENGAGGVVHVNPLKGAGGGAIFSQFAKSE